MIGVIQKTVRRVHIVIEKNSRTLLEHGFGKHLTTKVNNVLCRSIRLSISGSRWIGITVHQLLVQAIKSLGDDARIATKESLFHALEHPLCTILGLKCDHRTVRGTNKQHRMRDFPRSSHELHERSFTLVRAVLGTR